MSEVKIKELDKSLIHQANSNSMSGKRGDISAHEYEVYCQKVMSWNIHRKINSNKLARDRRRARQCRCIYKKQHKALSLSVSQNTRPAEIMPWA